MKKITNFLKRLTYQPQLSNFIWSLHLAGISRKIYFYLNRPSNGIMLLTIGEISVNFRVYDPWELRALEPAGKMGKEEHILKLLESKVNAGDVVYDVGSSFGIFTILLAKKVGPKGKE